MNTDKVDEEDEKDEGDKTETPAIPPIQTQLPRMKMDAKLGWRLFPRKRMPLYLQMQASECGLACLAMVLGHYGGKASLEDLRSLHDVSTRGMSMADMELTAQKMGLLPRSVHLEAQNTVEIQELRLPAVLHWAGSHWVVLSQFQKGTKANNKREDSVAQIYDPAQGVRWIGRSEFEERFTGYALDFSPSLKLERKMPQPKFDFWALLKSFPNLGGAVAQLFAISVLLEIIALLTPYYMQLTVDHVLVTADFEFLTILALATGFLLVFQTLFTAIRGWAGVMLTQNVGYQLFDHVLRHLFRLPIHYFMRRSTGDLVSRFDSVQTLAQSITQAALEIVLDVSVVIGTLLMMLLYSPALAGIVVAGFVIMLLAKILVFVQSVRITSERIYLDAKRQSHLIESLRAMHTLKMAQAQAARAGSWMGLTKRIYGKDADMARINLFSELVLTVTGGIVHILVIYFAAQLILTQAMTSGVLFAFLAYQANFTGRAGALIDRVLFLRTMKVHFGRISDIVFSEPEPLAQSKARSKNQPQNAALEGGKSVKAPVVSARKLGFRYSANDPFTLRGLDLDIPAASLTALTGRSGMGKTTLLCILGGVFLPSEGALEVDGVRMTPQSAVNSRAHVAFVFQNDELFEGSIEENISFFNPQIDPELVHECARLACIHTEIEALPAQYKTRLAEQGSGLSGGQRQRLLLARALYRKPTLLILDEATSQLDVKTEKQVLSHLKTLIETQGVSVVMSAHRPDAIAMADGVFSLELRKWIGEAKVL